MTEHATKDLTDSAFTLAVGHGIAQYSTAQHGMLNFASVNGY